MSTALTAARILLRSLLVGVFVCFVSWAIVELAPGTSAERAAIASGAIAKGDLETPLPVHEALVADVAREKDLQSSALLRPLARAARAVVFDYGESWRDPENASRRIASSAGLRSIVLCLMALLVAAVFACLTAPTSARHPGSLRHQSLALLAALILSIPIPWLALFALDAFAGGHPLSIAPRGGMDSIGAGILPILVLAAAPGAVLWRHLRERILDEAGAPWVMSARARGVTERVIWNQHLLRVATPTLLALLPVMLAYLLAATVVVERVFAIDGLGAHVARAARVGDAPVLIAFASVSAMLVSVATQLSSRVAAIIDPRREARS